MNIKIKYTIGSNFCVFGKYILYFTAYIYAIVIEIVVLLVVRLILKFYRIFVMAHASYRYYKESVEGCVRREFRRKISRVQSR